MNYNITLAQQFQDDLERLPENTSKRIQRKLQEFKKQINEYGIDPRHHNSTKFITEKRTWRLRIGDCRAFFDIKENTLRFTTVIPRSQAYND